MTLSQELVEIEKRKLRVRDVAMCHQVIKKDLKTISAWAHQWKMKFNPDITKQAIEVVFLTSGTNRIIL